MIKKEKLKKIFSMVLMIIMGFILGASASRLVNNQIINTNNIFLDLAFVIISCTIAFLFHIIIHEFGHLVFGLLSGYEFVSFRVGSLTIVKEDDKFKLKKFKLKGTAGQCLMMPKEDNYDKISYILYNLGGIIMNSIVLILCMISITTLHLNIYLIQLVESLLAIGILILITNGIPMKFGGVANDGYNVISIGKNKLMKYCFYTQLKVNGLLHKGVRIKDMPLEWFEVDKNADFSNPLVTSIKVIEANYYHDTLNFEKAKKCYAFLLNYQPKIMELYENEIKCELLFYEIVGDKNQDKINELYTKSLKKYIDMTDGYISRKRLMYAYYLIVEKDMNKVEQVLKEIEKVKKIYPVKAEIESELEIIEYINQKKLC